MGHWRFDGPGGRCSLASLAFFLGSLAFTGMSTILLVQAMQG